MRTLATTLKNLRDRLAGHSVQPELPIEAGFAMTAPDLPAAYRVHGTADHVAIGVDFHRRPVHVPLDHALVSGDPKTGVTSTVCLFALHAARFSATRLHVYDDNGEWPALKLIAHRFITRAYGIATGLSDDTAAAAVLADLIDLHTEMQRRNDHLHALSDDLAAAGGPAVRTLADLAKVSPDELRAAGIDPGRTDSETAGLHRHVVIIPGLDWWLSHPVHGGPIAEELFWLAGRGHRVGIHLVLGVRSHGLPAVPMVLACRIPTRIALPMRDPAHTNMGLGTRARPPGAVAQTAATRLAFVQAGEEPIRQVQIYNKCAWVRMYRAIGGLRGERERGGWLTGDARTLDTDTPSSNNSQHDNGQGSDGQGRR